LYDSLINNANGANDMTFEIRQAMKLNSRGDEVRDGWMILDSIYGMQVDWAPTKAEAQRIVKELNNK
jgi:hypothetical protein